MTKTHVIPQPTLSPNDAKERIKMVNEKLERLLKKRLNEMKRVMEETLELGTGKKIKLSVGVEGEKYIFSNTKEKIRIEISYTIKWLGNQDKYQINMLARFFVGRTNCSGDFYILEDKRLEYWYEEDNLNNFFKSFEVQIPQAIKSPSGLIDIWKK